MNYLKNLMIRYLWTILETIILSFLLTALYYFDFISTPFFSLFLLFSLLIPVFVNSFLLGKVSSKKGYLEGIKFSFLIILFFMIITCLYSKFQWKNLLYYAIILFTSIMGSIMGINQKKKT